MESLAVVFLHRSNEPVRDFHGVGSTSERALLDALSKVPALKHGDRLDIRILIADA